jgi:hypothetical protein
MGWVKKLLSHLFPGSFTKPRFNYRLSIDGNRLQVAQPMRFPIKRRDPNRDEIDPSLFFSNLGSFQL